MRPQMRNKREPIRQRDGGIGAGRKAAGHPRTASAPVFEKHLKIIGIDRVYFYAALGSMSATEDVGYLCH